MKLANKTPAHKRDLQNDNRNYRLVSVLSNILKVFENMWNHQTSPHFENIISKQQTGFRLGFNAQHCLLVMLEHFRKAFRKGRDYATLRTDLSKVFDCIPHDLIIVKLHAYGFNMPLVKLMNN